MLSRDQRHTISYINIQKSSGACKRMGPKQDSYVNRLELPMLKGD
jgi:hypothetical protein